MELQVTEFKKNVERDVENCAAYKLKDFAALIVYVVMPDEASCRLLIRPTLEV